MSRTTSYTEQTHAGQFILSLGNNNISLDNLVLAAGNVVDAGQVLGKLTSGGKLAPYNNSLSDGTQAAIGISLRYVDASDADAVIAVVVRSAEVKADELNWLSGTSDGDKSAAYVDLKALGIIARTSTGT